jgi:hypothetical protein
MPRLVRFAGFAIARWWAQCRNMTHFSELLPVPSSHISDLDQLQLAPAVYLTRLTGTSRDHTESDLRCYLLWCAGLDPLAAQRPHLEVCIRWMQEVRRFKPSTVSRRFSVVAGSCRACVIDAVLEHSPAEHVRRPPVSAESPTLGFTHLQFEALLTAARESANPNDFALVAMLGLLSLLGLRIFVATGADIGDLGEEQGTRGPDPEAIPWAAGHAGITAPAQPTTADAAHAQRSRGRRTPLIDATCSLSSGPRIAFNSLATDWERSEQTGLAMFMKGLFSTFRNPTAHAPKVLWATSRIDALDMLTLASMLHRRLDDATVR